MMVRMRPIQRAKRILRKQIKMLLTTISERDKKYQSWIITNKLFKLPVFASSQRIACYISNSMVVNTDVIIRQIISDKKVLFVPRFNIRKKTMDMLLVDSLQDYETLPVSKYNNNRQPKYSDLREEALDSGGLDLIIAPGLAFTKGGKRLGFGGGFYDTYLKNFKNTDITRPTFIGLAFKQQMFTYLPTHMHDICVDIVLQP